MPLSDRELLRVLERAGLGRGAAVDPILAAVAARQDGTVATRQLALCGVSRAAVSRRTAAGRLHPVFTGVHAVGHPAIGRRGRWQAALLASGPAAVLSHDTAAALRGVLDGDGPVHLTVPGAKGRRRAGLVTHSGRLEPADVERIDGLPVTSVARMLLDLGERLSVDRLVAVVDRCEGRRLYRPHAVARVMAAANGRHGLGTLRRALLVARPQDVLTRSELERRALRMVSRHRLPRPEVNAKILRYEVDLVWRRQAVAVELDGRTWHGDGVALDRDHRRDADLQVHGWRVLRFTWRQVVGEPTWVADRIARLLALAGDGGG